MAEEKTDYGSLEGGEPEQSDAQPTVEQLQKKLSNVTAQRDGLMKKQSASSSSKNASSNGTNPSQAQPSSSSADNTSFADLQKQLTALKKANDSLVAEKAASDERASFTKKAKKDGIELTSDDINMITDAKDQDAAYKYIKGLKANTNTRKYAPQANVFMRTKNNVGADIAKNTTSVKGLGTLISRQK